LEILKKKGRAKKKGKRFLPPPQKKTFLFVCLSIYPQLGPKKSKKPFYPQLAPPPKKPFCLFVC